MADTPIPASTVIASTHDDGVILLHTVEGRLFSANRAGACVWRGLAAGRSVDAIAAELSRDYGISGDVARQDVMRFLLDLGQQRLVEAGAR